MWVCQWRQELKCWRFHTFRACYTFLYALISMYVVTYFETSMVKVNWKMNVFSLLHAEGAYIIFVSLTQQITFKCTPCSNLYHRYKVRYFINFNDTKIQATYLLLHMLDELHLYINTACTVKTLAVQNLGKFGKLKPLCKATYLLIFTLMK